MGVYERERGRDRERQTDRRTDTLTYRLTSLLSQVIFVQINGQTAANMLYVRGSQSFAAVFD